MAALSLCLALTTAPLLTGSAVADEVTDSTEVTEPTGDSTAPEGQGSDDTATQTTAGTGAGTGRPAYGGRSTGPASLVTLPADPAFPVPEAPVNEALPEEVDEVAPWQGNIVCDPTDRPGLEAFANLLGEQYDRPVHSTSRSCIDQRSEHYDGRAVDWSLDAFDPQDRRIADAAVTWLTADDGEMAKRLGIQSIIWNSRSWRPGGAGWQAYAGQSPHTDHVHFSFTWDGAMMRTSWWTGVALTVPDQGPCEVVAGAYAAIPLGSRTEPCESVSIAEPWSGYTEVRPGDSGEGVGLVQPLLDVPQSGVLDVPTREALIAWQTDQGVPQTGVLDQLTYLAALGEQLPEIPSAALAVPLPEHLTTVYTPYRRTVLAEGDSGPAVELLQRALGVEPDGDFGPKTASAVRDFTAEHPLLTERESTGTLLWHVLETRDHPTLPYRQLALERGAEGVEVAVLQAQLGIEADGRFGPQTEAAVTKAQQEAGLAPTGVVDGPTWAATDGGVAGPDSSLVVTADLRGGNVEPWTDRD